MTSAINGRIIYKQGPRTYLDLNIRRNSLVFDTTNNILLYSPSGTYYYEFYPGIHSSASNSGTSGVSEWNQIQNIPICTSSTSGVLTSSDWINFNNKVDNYVFSNFENFTLSSIDELSKSLVSANFDINNLSATDISIQSSINNLSASLVSGSNNLIYLDRSLRCATFGDSTANTGGVGNTDIENLSLPLSASYTCNLDNTKACVASRLPVKYVANGGISGETLVQFLARTSATTSATRKSIYDVIQLNPDVVFFHGGSINDLANYIVSSATSAQFVQSTIERHKQIVDIFTSYGIYVIDPGIYGYNGTNSTSAWIQSQIPVINSAYETLSKSNDKWKFINVENKLSINGSYIPGMSTDGIHLNETGAMVLGDLEENSLNSIYNIKYIPKTMIYDRIKDYTTTATRPLNTTVSYIGTSGLSEITTPEKYRSIFTITSTTNELKMWISNTCFSNVVSGKNYFISPKFKIYDSSGNIYQNNINFSYRARIYVSGNAFNILFTNGFSNSRGNVDRILLPFSSPLNYVDFGSSTQFYTQVFTSLPLGTYTLEFYPEIIGVY